MSINNVKAFYEKVEEDKELQAKLKVLYVDAQKQKAATTAELIKVAAEAGFHFTPSDLAAAKKEAIEKAIDKAVGDGTLGGHDALSCMPGWKIVL